MTINQCFRVAADKISRFCEAVLLRPLLFCTGKNPPSYNYKKGEFSIYHINSPLTRQYLLSLPKLMWITAAWSIFFHRGRPSFEFSLICVILCTIGLLIEFILDTDRSINILLPKRFDLFDRDNPIIDGLILISLPQLLLALGGFVFNNKIHDLCRRCNIVHEDCLIRIYSVLEKVICFSLCLFMCALGPVVLALCLYYPTSIAVQAPSICIFFQCILALSVVADSGMMDMSIED